MARIPFPEYPHQAIGPKGRDSLHSLIKVVAAGSGLIGTVYGQPGFSATLVGSGEFNLRFRPTVEVDMLAHYAGPPAPSGITPTMPGGQKLDVQITDIAPASGTAKMWLSYSEPPRGNPGSGVATLTNVPSMAQRPALLGTGAQISIYFEDSPVSAY